MKNAIAITRFLEERIHCIYQRPLMYGFSPEAVDLILCYCHEPWAFARERDAEFLEAWQTVAEKARIGERHFAASRRLKRPPLSEPELAQYVVQQWQKISKHLSLPLGASDGKQGQPPA